MALTLGERLNTNRAQRITGAKTFQSPAALLVGGQIAKTTFFVLDRDLLTDAALTPSEGQCYLMPASGVIAGGFAAAGLLNNEIANYTNGAWQRITPAEGWVIDVADEDLILRYTGAAWQVSSRVLSGSGSPVGVVTPEFKGQLYIDDVTQDGWLATGVTSADWSLATQLSAVTVFPTVAALKASTLDLEDLRYVQLLGYHTAGDGGGGLLVHLLTDGGVFGKLTITNGGTGYQEGIHRVSLTGGNSDATAWVYSENGIIVDGWIEHPGTGYTAAAAPDLSGLGGASFAGTFALGDDGEAFVQTAYAATARRFVRRQSEPFSARQFGAKGDTIQSSSTGALTNRTGGAVNDDTDALQRLFNKGRLVRLGVGTFAISSELRTRFGTILKGDRAWTAVSPQRQITGNPRTTTPVTVVSQKLAYDLDHDSTIIWNGAASTWDVDAQTGTPLAMVRASATAVGDDGAGWNSNVSADTIAMYGVGLIDLGLDCNNKADMGLFGWLCGWGSAFSNLHAWRAKWAGIFMTDLWSTVIDRIGAFYCEDNGLVFGQPHKAGAKKFFPLLGGIVNAVQFNNPRAAWCGLVGGAPGTVADGGGNSKQFSDSGANGGVAGFPNYHGHGLYIAHSRGNVVINPQGEICDGAGVFYEGTRDTDNGMANKSVGGYAENNGYHAVDEARAVFEYNFVVVSNNGMSGFDVDSLFVHPFGKIWLAGDTANFNAGTGVTLLPNDYVKLRNCKTSGVNATGTGGVTAAGLRADHKYYTLIDCDIELHNNIVGSTVGSSGVQPDPAGGVMINGSYACPDTICLARGTVNLNSGTTSFDENFNLRYISNTTGNYVFGFASTTPAQNANYTVLLEMEGLDGNSEYFHAHLKQASRTTTQFEVEVRTGPTAGNALNNAAGKKLHVAIFGRRDVTGLVKS